MKRMWVLVCLSLASIAAQAQDGLYAWETYEKRIKASSEVPAHGPDLFGDQISLSNGAVTFSVTDVSVPGNSALPVAFGRTFTVSNRKDTKNDGSLADWHLDVPHISGVFAPDWVGSVPGNPGKRCSVTSTLHASPPPPSGGNFGVEDFWNGNTLHIPGHEGGELLLLRTATPRPSTGGPYYWHVAGHSVVSCLATTKNQPGHEGFLVTTADGTRYWFDWAATYYEPPLRFTVHTIHPITGDPTPSTGTHVRRRVALYATRVEDRFGNSVVYTYNNAATQPAKLESIVASDGRRINVTYASARVTQVESVASDATNRVWRYEYVAAPDSQMSLARVILPGDTPAAPNRWTLELAGLSRAKIQQWSAAGEPSRNCVANWGWWSLNGPNQFSGRMTHPSGAVGEFDFEIMTHGRSWVPRSCSLGMPPSGPGQMDDTSDDVNRWAISYESFTLKKKTLSGPGVASSAWIYEYQPNTGPAPLLPGQVPGRTVCPPMVDCSIPQCTDDSCAKSAVTTVRLPDGGWERYWHGNTYLYNEGKLLKVERGGYDANGNEKALNRTINTYDLSGQDAAYPARYGTSARDPGNAFAVEYHRPLLQTLVQQQNTNFSRVHTVFNLFAQPVTSTRSSTVAGNPTRTETTLYRNDLQRWVLGQIERVTLAQTNLPGVTVPLELRRSQYSSTSGLPEKHYVFGRPVQLLTYHPDGNVKSVSDGRDTAQFDTTITLSNWKRGIPGHIRYPPTPEAPSGAVQTATVNGHGWITGTVDEGGAQHAYQHDLMGRLTRVGYPAEDAAHGIVWNDTTHDFSRQAGKYGLPTHWRWLTSTGNARTVIRYDAMWRPVIEERYDNANPDATRSLVVKRYDAAGRLAFQSHPLRTLTDYRTVTAGTYTEYDALGRVTKTRVPSVDGPGGWFTTTTEYLAGFAQRVTSPNLVQTTTRFMAWDEPTTDYPVAIVHPEGAFTDITRNAFGKPTVITRRNATSTVSVTRTYTYNTYQELCRSVEPETGATLMGYDAAGNLAWSAAGLPATTACHATGNTTAINARRVDREYDARNRLKVLDFPDGNGNQTWDYYADGKPSQIATWNIGAPGADPKETRNLYTYYKRGLLKTELIAVPAWYTFSVEHGYNANGFETALTYPSGHTVTSAVNALGQPTSISGGAQTYASGIKYHPNGAVAEFYYGNQIRHTMVPNDRLLPDTVSSKYGSTEFLDDQYDYDGHGNVLSIVDDRTGKAGRRSRAMTYDDLDRLTKVASPMYGSAGANYTYNVLDDLMRVQIGGAQARDHHYCYDASRRLVRTKIGGCTGTILTTLDYDLQGNLASRNDQGYRFDFGNRLREVDGVERYRYDGHGRRVLAMQFATGTAFSQYGLDGKLLYQKSGRTGLQSDHVYLGSSLVAIRELPISGPGAAAMKYQHTDALGSPVVVTRQDRTIVEETEYEPYGRVLNRPMHDGAGYTGHVEDAATGLVYMQQRYYDPQIGGFLSVDPVTAYQSNDWRHFNRYSYAFNNPYRFTDPDGRDPHPIIDRLFPKGDIFRTTGEAFGALAAYTEGVLTGNEALQQTALDGMRENVSARDGFAAATMVVGPRGGMGASKAPGPYSRPSNATTPAQRASVQGQPCVKCGAESSRQVAGHKTALVREYHQTGTIDKAKMRSTDAVQPECRTCSAREGAEMSRYSREMNKQFER